MFDISLSTANTLFSFANKTLVVGATLILVGTIGANWTNGVKERYAYEHDKAADARVKAADERISANELQTATAKAEAARANEAAEELRNSNLKLQESLDKVQSDYITLQGRAAIGFHGFMQ